MTIDLASNQSAITTDSFGVNHVVWVENATIWHAVYDTNSATWINATAIAAVGTEPVTNLNLVANPNLIQVSSNISIPGLAVVWQQGSDNNSELNYTAAQYDQTGQLQWLANPQSITSDQVADLEPTVLVYQPSGSGSSNPEVLVVGTKVNLDRAANQAIREDTDLYSQQFSVSSSLFSTDNTVNTPIAPYEPQIATNGLVNLGVLANSSTTPPANTAIAPANVSSTAEEFSASNPVTAASASNSSFQGFGAAWNAQLTFSGSLPEDWKLMDSAPADSFLRTVISPWIKNLELVGVLQGGQSPGWENQGKASIFLDANTTLNYKNPKKFNGPWKVTTFKNATNAFIGDDKGNIYPPGYKQKEKSKSPITFALQADSKYKFGPSSPYDLQSISDTLSLTASMKFPIIPAVETGGFFTLDATGSLGLNWSVTAKPTTPGGSYVPQTLGAALTVLGGGAFAESALLAVSFKSAEATSGVTGAAIAIDLAETLAAFIEGLTQGLDTSGTIGFPVITGGLSGKAQIPKIPFASLNLKAQTSAAFNWGLGGADNTIALNFPLGATLNLGPVGFGFNVKPGWKWNVFDGSKTKSSATIATPTILAAPDTASTGLFATTASVQGSLLTIDLGTTFTQLPQASDFTVTVTDLSGNITTIPVFNVLQGSSNTSLVLQLTTPIPASQNYDYPNNNSTPSPANPTSDTVQLSFSNQEGLVDSEGNVIANVTNLAVANNTPATQTTTYNPTNGNSQSYSDVTLVLSFNTPLNASILPDYQRFTVQTVGSNPTLLAVQSVQITSNSVILVFNSSVTNQEVQNVTISYNDSSSSGYGNLLTDANNNALGNFTINNGVSTQVSQSTIFISSENNSLASFSSTPSDYAVSVTDADGNLIQETVTLQTVSVSSQGVLLTINQNISPTQNATVTYQNNQLQTTSLVAGITPPAVNTQSTIANVEADLGQDSSPTLALIPTSSTSFELLIAWVSDVPPITPIAGFVNGNAITLNFVNDLGNTASSDPATTQFTVTDQNNNPYTVTNVSVVGNSLTLTLAQTVTSDTQLTVGYKLVSSSENNQNLFLTDATDTQLWVDDFSAFSLTNTTGNTTNSPQLIGAGSIVETSTSNQITLVFDQKLNGNPTNNDFIVQSNGVNFAIAATVTVNDNTVILSVQPTGGKDLIGVGDIVSVSYSGSELSGANGTGTVADFSNIPVTTAPPEPTTVIKYNLAGNLSSIPGSDGFNFYPVAAVDQKGNGVVVWVHADSSNIPTSLTPGEFYTDNDTQVINDNLNASDIYYSIYDTTTKQWSLAAAVFAQAGADAKVTLGMGPNNNLMAAWINSNNGVNQIYWSSLSYDPSDPSSPPTWSKPQVLYSNASPDPLTELTISNLGGSQPAVFWTETQSTSYTQLTTEASPILYFRLDETSGTLANNEGTWGAGGNGTYSGTVSFNQVGALENTTNNSGDADPATLFEAGSSLTLPNAISFSGNSFSIEFWFKAPALPSEAIALVSMEGLASFSFDASGLSLAINGQTLSSAGTTFAANQWYYVVASYDGQTDTAALFVNGQPVANQQNLNITLPTSTNITLASPSNTSNVYLDEVAFYSKVLSYSDVSASALQSPDLTGYQLAQIMLSTNEIGNKYDAQYVAPLPPGPNTYYVTYDSSSGSWGNTSSQIEPNYEIIPTQLADANQAKVDIVANQTVSAGQPISPNGIEDTIFQSILTGYPGKTITGIAITVNEQVYVVGSANIQGNQLGVMVGEVLINSLNPQNTFSYTVLSNSVNLDLIIDTGNAPSNTDSPSVTSYTLYFSDGSTASSGSAQSPLSLPTYVPPNSEPLTASGVSVLGTATVTEVNDSSLALIDSGFIIPTNNPAMGYALGSGDFNKDGYSDVAVGNRGYTNTSGVVLGRGSVQILFGQQTVLTNGETNPLTPTDLSGNPNGLLITGIDDGGQANGDYPLSLATGDVNGDGYDDLIIGAPNVNDQQGAVYVIYGSSSLAGQIIDVTTMSSSQGYVLNAPTTGQIGFGFSVATGNFNGDTQGQIDIAVGAPGEVQSSGSTGAVYVFQDGKQNSYNTLWSNDSSSHLFGYSLAVSHYVSGEASTFSGNKSDDLIIGMPGYIQEVTNSWTGLNNLPNNTNQQNNFPSSSPTSVGQVQVWQSNGTATNTFSVPWASFTGPNLPSNNGTANDFLAGSALAIQDWNGDGTQDLAIAAPGGYINTGVIYIIQGGNSSLANTSPQSLNSISNLIIAGGLPLSQTGAVIASPGDVNDDGYQDFLITAPQGANGTGQSYLLFGRSDLYEVGTVFDLNVTANDNKTTFLLNGSLPYQLTGTAVGGIGDINNDGVDDLMVSAPNAAQLYAVYGHPWLADDGSIKLANISGDNGFVTDGDLYSIPTEIYNTSDQSSTAPALISNNGTLYLAYTGTGTNNTQIYFTTSQNNGKTWSSPIELPSGMTTSSSPSLAFYNNTLYLAYVGGNNELNITYSTDNGQTWSSQYTLGQYSAAGVSLTVYQNQLLAVFVSTESNNDILYVYSDNPQSSGSWSTDYSVANPSNIGGTQQASTAIAATVLNDTLYLGYRGGTVGDANNYYVTSTNTQTLNNLSWEVSELSGITSPNTAPSLTNNGTNLYFTYAAQNTDIYYLTSTNGSNWSTPVSVSNQTTSYTPSATILGNLLYLGYAGENTNIYVTPVAQNQSLLPGTGQDVVMLGDINGDGFADVLAGGSPNGAVIIFGNSTKDLLDAAAGSDDLIVTVQGANIQQVTNLGDYNGDGLNDFGVLDSAEHLYVVFGSSALASQGILSLNPSTSQYITTGGESQITGGICDYNGDGYDDFLLLNYIQLGGATFNSNREVEIQTSGILMSAVGDLNGDGYSDIALGNPNSNVISPNGTGNGQATVYLGNASAIATNSTNILPPSASISGTLNNNNWGFYNLGVQQTDVAPSFAVFNGYLYMVYKSNDSQDLYIQRSADGYNWEGLTDLGSSFETNSQASLAVFNNTLYLAFTATNGEVILAPATLDSSSAVGVSFSSSTFFQVDGQTANSGPTLVSYNDALYVFFEAQDSSNAPIRYNYSSDPSNSSSWTDTGQTIAGQSTRDRVGATVVNDPESGVNTLIVSFLSSDSNSFYTTTTTDGLNWNTTEISGQSSVAGPSLATVGDTAYLFFISSNNNQELLYVTSTDQGQDWSSSASNIPGQTTIDRPSPVFFQENLLVGFAGTNSAINVSTSNPIFELNQTQNFGQQLQNIGDFNGDGIVDLAVLASGFISNLGSINNNLLENNQGAVLIYYGNSSGITNTASPDVVLATPAPNASTSTANNQAILLSNFSGAGDINGDGYDDLIIASPNTALDSSDTTDGSVLVVFGGSKSFWQTGQTNNATATNSFNLGSLSPLVSTLTLQFDQSLKTTSIPATSLFSITNGFSAAGSIFVTQVAVNGNNVILTLNTNVNTTENIAITYSQPTSGGLENSSGSQITGFTASTTPQLSTNDAPLIDFTGVNQSQYGFVIAGLPNSQTGISLSGGGDVNGDGFSDFIIGAPGNNDNLTYTLFGSDFNKTVSQTGTIGDDVMLGSPTGESFLAGQGNDQIYGKGGLDVVYAGPGDDYVTVTDTYFQRLDGGTGTDVLALTGYNGQDWDLTTLAPGLRLRNFEILVTENYGANTLTLNSLTVAQVSSNNTLTLVMDDADTLNLSSDFSAAGTVYQYNQKFYKYTSNVSAATVLVNQSLGKTTYQLVLNNQGSLVLLSPSGETVWTANDSSGNTITGATQALMQTDGNFVLYDAVQPVNQPGQSSASLWSTGTSGEKGAYLRLESNGSLVVVSANSPDTILKTLYAGTAEISTATSNFYATQQLLANQTLTVFENNFNLTASVTNNPNPILPPENTSNLASFSNLSVDETSDSVSLASQLNSLDTTNTPTQLFVSNPTGAELDGSLDFTIQRTGDLTKSVLVSYITQDGNGKSGDRYVPVVGQLVFAPDETSKTINVKIPNNNRYVGDRQFGLLVSLVKEDHELTNLPQPFKLEADANGAQIRRWSLTNGETQLGLFGGTLQFDTTVTDGQAQINISVSDIGDFNSFYSYNAQTGTYEELMLNASANGATFTYSPENTNDTPDGIQLNFIKDGDRGDVDNIVNGLAKTNGYAGRTIPGLITNNNKTFWAATNADGRVQWRLIGAPSENYEMGWIRVDDQNGTIDNLKPTDGGYEASALARKQVIFQDQNSASDQSLTRTLAQESFTNPSSLAKTERQFFGELKNSNLEANNYYMLYKTEGGKTTFSVTDAPEIQTDSRGYHQLSFSGVTAEIASSTLVVPGVLNQSVKMEVSLSRAAVYNNLIALYRVDNLTGGLDLNGDQLIDLKPGDSGYSQAALERAKDELTGVTLTTPDNLGTTKQTIDLLGNNMYGMVIIPNATIEQVLSQNPSNDSSVGPVALFSFGSANPDGISHMARLGNNLFGFEDILGGGDLDYNDMILQIKIPSLV